MRSRIRSTLALAFAATGFLSSPTVADSNSIRLAESFRDAAGHPFLAFSSISEIMERLSLGVQLHVRGAKSCQELLAIPIGQVRGFDSLRETDTIIQTITIECWVLLQIDPSAEVDVAGPGDEIRPELIYGIMAKAAELSLESEEWAKTLMDFPGGDITCRDAWHCLLSRPDGRNPPEQSLIFDLILAFGDTRFIKVTQLVHGRFGFVYGVEWQGTNTGGKVVTIFPDLQRGSE